MVEGGAEEAEERKPFGPPASFWPPCCCAIGAKTITPSTNGGNISLATPERASSFALAPEGARMPRRAAAEAALGCFAVAGHCGGEEADAEAPEGPLLLLLALLSFRRLILASELSSATADGSKGGGRWWEA